MPQLGATFVPSGFDDYYMPEVVAPSPQRVMPEVPQNMQEDLQRMELEAHSVDTSRAAASSTQPSQQGRHGREASLSNILTRKSPLADQTRQTTGQGKPETEYKPFANKSNPAVMQSSFEAPSFSPFPKVKGDNVPHCDEEKEEILYNAQQTVLHSNDVRMQLSWARDALSWVEISSEAYARENPNDGKRPQTPKVEHDLRVNALSIVDYLAQQDHPEALFMWSKFLEFGKFGHRTDKKEAYAGYKRAAEQGWGRAEYRMGMLFENSNDIDKAIRHYNAGLALKDSAASYRMGMMHLLGQHGFRRDYNTGLELIQQAAETADEDAPQGAYVFSMLISRDLPEITIPEDLLPLDLSIARQYCEKAAYLGFAKAQQKMGQAYELCQLGCDFDPKHSLHYYGLAARQGQPEASLGVSRWFLFGYEREFQKNEQLAYKYAKMAALSGLATGEFAMGYYHEVGISVPKNLREARVWYEKAAEHDNKDAIARLEQLNQDKTLSKSDHETQTLGRIKSQHGSMRGKRPDRFKAAAAALPALTESGPNTPSHSQPPYGPPAGGSQPGINLPRPVSAAPYPVDDKPAPLNVRPKSTAPYPDDDVPGFKHRLQSGGLGGPMGAPHADRPQSAFGIRSLSPSGRPDPRASLPANQMGNLGIPPAGTQPPRGRIASADPVGWEGQPNQQGGYRQPSPHGQQQPQPPYGHNQARPMSGGGGPPVGDPTRNKLTKNDPNFPSQQYPTPGTGPAPVPGHPAYGPQPGQPGRDYSGGRPPQARPASDMYMSGAAGGGHRTDSMPMPSQSGGGGALPTNPRPPMKDRPAHLQDPMGGRASAPPAQGGGMGALPQGGRPGGHQTPGQAGRVSSHGSTASAPAKPSQGPATFEQMGITQGKEESDCVVM